jgi:hypothetical protein
MRCQSSPGRAKPLISSAAMNCMRFSACARQSLSLNSNASIRTSTILIRPPTMLRKTAGTKHQIPNRFHRPGGCKPGQPPPRLWQGAYELCDQAMRGTMARARDYHFCSAVSGRLLSTAWVCHGQLTVSGRRYRPHQNGEELSSISPSQDLNRLKLSKHLLILLWLEDADSQYRQRGKQKTRYNFIQIKNTTLKV